MKSDREREDASVQYYPDEIRSDLDGIDLPQGKKIEILTCAYQYTRCVIPHYTNKRRYIAFMRTIIIGTVAEFRGDLVDIAASDSVLSYSVGGVIADLFRGTDVEQVMAREFRTFLLFTAEKTTKRRHGELFQRYRAALIQSPRQWFRMRDADALVRFSIAAALACNDRNITWLTEEKLEVLAEIAVTLYDAVAFRKHRAEDEPCSTFAYAPCREEAYRWSRHMLWSLDVACNGDDFSIVANFIRPFGGPIHMMMHRYRFVEEGLTIGKPEDDEVKELASRNVKLWFRPVSNERLAAGDYRYQLVQSKREQLLFPGLVEMLEHSRDAACSQCQQKGFRSSDGLRKESDVRPCDACAQAWLSHYRSITERVADAFPEIEADMALWRLEHP